MSSTAETVGSFAARNKRIPSRAWYWMAAAVVLLGVGCGVTWGVISTIRTHDRAAAMSRASAPGRLDVTLDAGASRLIFFEGEGRPSPETLGLQVTGPSGSSVPVERYDLLMEYEIAGWIGSPIASFSAPTSGTYTVSAENSYHEGDFSVGDNFVRTQAINIGSALVLIAASLFVGLVIVSVVAVKRSQSGRAAVSS